jgi:phosphate starvation-inducible PhoH-like protein
LASEGQGREIKNLFNDFVLVTDRGKKIRPKTLGQKKYVEALRRYEIVFGIGPAGTGKTYLAMAAAVSALKNKIVQRLVLTRPAVEAGEHLGFLPGDLHDKVDPYLRPLYDALYDLMGVENFLKYREKGIIEVAPLAYMRGRTLDDSFIILDEAQNTTPEQMKMFLTRMGFGSRAVITGDITQVDLPRGKFSGLIEVMDILKGIEEIAFIHLGDQDVVRHNLVQKIIKAYDNYAQEKICNSEGAT